MIIKRYNFIVETEEGESIAYGVVVTKYMPYQDIWALAVSRMPEFVPEGQTVIRLEFENVEVL